MAAYTGLYVYDVYDAVQGGDPSIPNNPFNLSVSTVTYSGTDYRRCTFPFSQNDKIIRYALTRKSDGMMLVGLTKLSTYANYGDWVGISINGGTVPPDSGTQYREFAATSLTEIAVRLSNYGDPIAFWLPGATLVPDTPETRCILYKHTGFTETVDVIDPSTTPSGPYGTYGTGARTGNANSVSTLSPEWATAVRFGQEQVRNSIGRDSSPAPGGRSGGGSGGGEGDWTSRGDLVFVVGVDSNGNRGGQLYKKDKDGNLTEPSGPFIPSPSGPEIGQ